VNRINYLAGPRIIATRAATGRGKDGAANVRT